MNTNAQDFVLLPTEKNPRSQFGKNIPQPETTRRRRNVTGIGLTIAVMVTSVITWYLSGCIEYQFKVKNQDSLGTAESGHVRRMIQSAWAGNCGDGICEQDETSAICPEDCMRFGVHHASNAEVAQELQIQWTSMQPQVWWEIFEPDKGEYDLGVVSKLDRTIAGIQSVGVQPVVTLNSLSSWGTTNAWDFYQENPNTYPHSDYPDPEDVEAWERFVNDLVERYDGDGVKDMPGLVYPVRYWHILEEWKAWYNTNTIHDVERYVDLLEITYPIIKQHDPSAKVVLAGLFAGSIRLIAYVEGFINDPEAGRVRGVLRSRAEIAADFRYQLCKAEVEYMLREGKGYFDVVDLHLYTSNYRWQKGILDWTKAKMSEHGYSKPMICVECGGPIAWSDEATLEIYTDKKNAEYVVKLFTTAFANGLQAHSWGLMPCTPRAGRGLCDFWGERFRIIQLLNTAGIRKPSFYTYGLMSSKLDGYSSVNRVDVGGDSYVYGFLVNNKPVFVAWNDVGATVDLSQFLSVPNVKITHIVIELDGNNNPIYRDDEIVSAKSIELTEPPIFIELAE